GRGARDVLQSRRVSEMLDSSVPDFCPSSWLRLKVGKLPDDVPLQAAAVAAGAEHGGELGAERAPAERHGGSRGGAEARRHPARGDIRLRCRRLCPPPPARAHGGDLWRGRLQPHSAAGLHPHRALRRARGPRRFKEAVAQRGRLGRRGSLAKGSRGRLTQKLRHSSSS
ncbi:unnamed protein product, partial [Prorocentrum cordatum]